jgi:hypothetical protein
MVDLIRDGNISPTPKLLEKMMNIVEFYDSNPDIPVDRDQVNLVFKTISNYVYGILVTSNDIVPVES